MGRQRGRLTNSEREFIAANIGRYSVEDIAERLNRTVETVQAAIAAGGLTPMVAEDPAKAEKAGIRAELRRSEKWKRLLQELSDDELAFFEEEYIKLMAQFRGDVFASEETQIFDVIKFDLLKSRNLVERKRARAEINRLEKMQEDLYAKCGGDPSKLNQNQREFALNLETQLNESRDTERRASGEFVKLQERQDSLMKSLKAQRDQRIKDVDSGKDTILGLLKKLQRAEFREVEGRQMELVKMAGKKEYERLGQLYEYEDGEVDRPILSPETVAYGDGETEEEE